MPGGAFCCPVSLAEGLSGLGLPGYRRQAVRGSRAAQSLEGASGKRSELS